MGHKSCIGVFDPSSPHKTRALSFYLRIYLWVSTKGDCLFFKNRINDDLFGIISWELAIFRGKAPGLIHNYRSLCMIL